MPNRVPFDLNQDILADLAYNDINDKMKESLKIKISKEE